MTGNTNPIKLAILLLLALLLVVAGPSVVFAQTGDGDVIGDDGLVDEVEIEDEDDDDNFFCASADYEHPIAAAIARSYDVEYEDVMGWFCEDELGLGQIALALHTAAVIAAQEADEEDVDDEDVDDEDEPVTAAELLTMRLDGYGWGQIWQEYGFVGRPRGESMGLALGRARHDVDDEADVDDENEVDDEEDEVDTTETTGRPANAGRPDNPGSSNSNGNGRPDNPGSSNSNGNGRPDNPGAANKGGRK